jgi:hypothetical protein
MLPATVFVESFIDRIMPVAICIAVDRWDTNDCSSIMPISAPVTWCRAPPLTVSSAASFKIEIWLVMVPLRYRGALRH